MQFCSPWGSLLGNYLKWSHIVQRWTTHCYRTRDLQHNVLGKWNVSGILNYNPMKHVEFKTVEQVKEQLMLIIATWTFYTTLSATSLSEDAEHLLTFLLAPCIFPLSRFLFNYFVHLNLIIFCSPLLLLSLLWLRLALNSRCSRVWSWTPNSPSFAAQTLQPWLAKVFFFFQF